MPATPPATRAPVHGAGRRPGSNPAPPPASTLLPVTITNNTGRSDPAYRYVLAVT